MPTPFADSTHLPDTETTARPSDFMRCNLVSTHGCRVSTCEADNGLLCLWFTRDICSAESACALCRRTGSCFRQPQGSACGGESNDGGASRASSRQTPWRVLSLQAAGARQAEASLLRTKQRCSMCNMHVRVQFSSPAGYAGLGQLASGKEFPGYACCRLLLQALMRASETFRPCTGRCLAGAQA